MASSRPPHAFTDRDASLYYEPHRRSFAAQPHRRSSAAQPHRRSFSGLTPRADPPEPPTFATPHAFFTHHSSASAHDLLRRISSMRDPPTFATTSCGDVAPARLARARDGSAPGHAPRLAMVKDPEAVEFIRKVQKKKQQQQKKKKKSRKMKMKEAEEEEEDGRCEERELLRAELLEWKAQDGFERRVAPEERRWEEAAEEEGKRERGGMAMRSCGLEGNEAGSMAAAASSANEVEEDATKAAEKKVTEKRKKKKKRVDLIAIFKKAFHLNTRTPPNTTISPSS